MLVAGCGRIGFAPALDDSTVGAGDAINGDAVMATDMFAPATDTYIIQNSTVLNDGDAQLFIGRSAGGNAAATLLQFDVSTLAGATVTSASLQLYQFTSMGNGSMDIIVERITASWDATTVIYATRPTWDAAPLASQPVALQTPGFTQWDVTSAARQWLAGTAPNFGLVLEAPSASNGTMIQMVSLDNSAVAQRPQLTVVTLR